MFDANIIAAAAANTAAGMYSLRSRLAAAAAETAVLTQSRIFLCLYCLRLLFLISKLFSAGEKTEAKISAE